MLPELGIKVTPAVPVDGLLLCPVDGVFEVPAWRSFLDKLRAPWIDMLIVPVDQGRRNRETVWGFPGRHW